MTDSTKLYVLQHKATKMYVTRSKSKSRKVYFGLYIGTAGKRYGAVRFEGGEDLDRLLGLPGNRDLQTVEVKA
jgi:hypothetical protein